MIRGWKEKTNYTKKDIFKKYNNSNIRGYVLTDVERDGMLSGLNINLIKQSLELTSKKLIVGGGLSSYDDLINLKKINSNKLEGVIAGKSFYLGMIEIKKSQKIIESNA